MKNDNDSEKREYKSHGEDREYAAGNPRILLAEDDIEMRRMLALQMRNAGFDVIECSDGQQLLERIWDFGPSDSKDHFDLIVSDIRMPGFTGLEVLEGITDTQWFTPMILITAFGDRRTHAEAQRLGATAVFDKPFNVSDLLAKIREILVLDSPGGHNWSPSLGAATRPAQPSVDVVFSHLDESDYLIDLVKKEAAQLSAEYSNILYCRVVLIGPHDQDSGGHYHIQVMVTTPDRVYVMRSNLMTMESYQDLVAAIPTAFRVTAGRIDRHLNRHGTSSAAWQ
jgi:DNA-binding response OmpR family regulator